MKKIIFMVKESSSEEVIAELNDIINDHGLIVKIVSDDQFDLMVQEDLKRGD